MLLFSIIWLSPSKYLAINSTVFSYFHTCSATEFAVHGLSYVILYSTCPETLAGSFFAGSKNCRGKKVNLIF